MAIPAAAIMAGSAILGGIAGQQGQKQVVRNRIGGQTSLGRDIDQMFGRNLNTLEDFASTFGLEDVQRGRQAQIDLANELQRMSEGAFLPSTQDINQARTQSQNLLAGQRAGLQNIFERQQDVANRQAAQMGRSTNDPILQAQLRRAQAEQESELLGQEQAMTQQIASSLPLQRLQFQQQRAGVLGGLGNQATTLRSNLLGMGTNVQNLQNQIRLGGSTRTATQGGGMQGFLTGALGGAGAGLGLASGLNSMGAFGGSGGSSNPWATQFNNKPLPSNLSTVS